ncbi:MAG: hypothetical protein WCF60_08940 [Anaerobacillus sp.]
MEKFDQYRKNAESKLRMRLIKLIRDKKQVVIDFSFWDRVRRNQYKKLIELSGGKWKLIYLKFHPNQLRERLKLGNNVLMQIRFLFQKYV